MCDEVRLVRHDLGETPWGFRITGGRDFGTPLLVVKVVGGSIAALAGVQVGDLVRGINYVPTNDFTHLDAQRAILESGDTLILNLLKGGEYEQYYQPEPLPAFSLPEPIPPPPIPAVPVIDIQSPEDKEVEEIGQQEVSENLELAFVVHLDRSGRISAVEEVPTPSTTPRTTPTSRRTSSTSGDKRRKSSGSSTGKTPSSEESEKKSKVSVTVHDNGPINIQPPSYEDATRHSKSKEKKESSKQQEVTLHEELRVETSTKKTTTEIKERTEEEFIMGVRDQIVARAHKEKRELTEDEIAEMMAGEAEVIEASKGKEVIGVNFQKFMPKCDFIKDSEVFKVLQEEQIKKEKSEEEQLERDPLKRFSKFLIKPKTAIPIEKPKPIHPEPMAWQQRLNASVTSEKKSTALTESTSAVKTNEVRKESLKTEQETVNETKQVEQRKQSEETENITLSTVQENDENLTIRIQKSEKQEYNEVIRKKEEGEEEETNEIAENKVEEELETIDWKEEKSEKQKESNGVLSNKRSSLEDGRRSKTKKVGFVGLQFKEDIEKQLAEIQKELLTLQRLPIEIQNHLLVVQQSLQDIVAQRSQMQTPVDDDEKIEATEVYTYNPYDDDNEGDIVVKKDDESINRDENDESEIIRQESHHEELSISKKTTSNVEESVTVTSSVKSEQYESSSSSSYKEVNDEVSNQENEDETAKEIKNKTEEKNLKKDLPHGQEDVEICESTVKPALPLTPQLRPIKLPGGRKWVQPRDAYTEEFIAETLVSQSEVLVGTTIGVNFRKYIPPKFDTSNSAVYRLIHDIEDRTKKGVAERPEKIHGLEEFYHPPIDKRHFYAAQLAEKKHVDNLNKQQYSGPAHH